ncbi:diacylglycerol kinase [Sulfuricurvum sp. IAE1]|uniref:diacylglycerol kinase n=1 Tax=Sulfuricurvum sp. IAE1 TaxID=2546102 RepID=UPI00104A2A7E|nr:diacylglycerol kinase [Sulfuricurvum sp. IAE1]MDD3770855.1 diacylglycerol kinase [Sulfuricurvum sp.]TDA64217.1 diacylglycerol kinase [Sulfuricurvum sp. IAE1]
MKNKFLGTGERGYHPWRKFRIILSGLRFAVIYDFSVLYKIILSVAVLIPVMIFSDKLNASLIVLATGVMLSAEIFNTAIEAMCDFMETRYNEKILIIKDIAAAAAGISIFAWLAVLSFELVQLLPLLRSIVG